jgi:lipopolysaccharide/colanic/teichoic acid biosynthesis glycosyltransferase
MKSMENIKETTRNGIKNNYIKIMKFRLQKENKPKLEHEEQRGKRRRSCSLDFGPENVHQSK